LEGELILLSEVREAAARPVVQVLVNLDASVQVEQDVLSYLIERRLLSREIQYLAFPKEAERIKTLATQHIITTYYQGDEGTFADRLSLHEITDTQLEQELTLYMKGLDYIRRKYRFNADVDDPDVVLKLFQQWLDELHAKAEVQTL